MNARQAIAEANKELDAQCVAAGIPSDYGYLTEAGQLADLAWSKQRVAVFLETEPGWKDIKDADGWLHLHLHVNAVWTGTALEVVKKALGGGRLMRPTIAQTANGWRKEWTERSKTMNEYTDHEAAHRECDGSSGDCERMTAERGALRADNERLRELVRAQVQAGCSCPDCRVWMDRARDALGFYANQDNWRNAGSPSGFDNDGVPAEWDEVPQSSACAENQGATARAALGEITNGISHAS